MENAIATSQIKTFSYRHVMTSDMAFRVCCWLYLISFAILPDWFGFYLGMLFSAKRIMLVLCFAMMIFSRKRLNRFVQMIKKLTVANILIGLYMFVRLYTAVYRRNVQTFAGEFLDGVLVFYFFCYLLRYEFSTASLFKFLRVTLWILCLCGLFEYLTQINLFSFLNTSNAFLVTTNVRGELRLQGNCHHPIQFGMYISMLFCLSCYDPKTNKLFLFRHPMLFILASLCVFFSGSRGPFGLYLVTLPLICLFSGKDERIKSFVILLAIIAALVIVMLFLYKTYVGQWILHMFASVIDSIFDTTLVNDYFSQLGINYDGSTAYRDALAKVFQLDYLNPLIGRGSAYQFSVVIDGIWLQSGDNNFVNTYVVYAYPGLITQALLFLLCLGLSLWGRIKQKEPLFGAIFVAAIVYIIGLWFVAAMGTFMYFWMLLAIAVMRTRQDKHSKMRKLTSKPKSLGKKF